MYRPQIKMLDCTIRDGGLINNEHPRAAIACRESDDKDKYAEFYERLLEGVIDE